MGEDSVKPFLEYDGKWVIPVSYTHLVGMHNVKILWVAAQDIRYDRAESLWEDTLVAVSYTHLDVYKRQVPGG